MDASTSIQPNLLTQNELHLSRKSTNPNYLSTKNLRQHGGGGGIRGNVDADVADAVNVPDLTYLVEFLFFDGPAPAPCP